jgi:hypothetical protein
MMGPLPSAHHALGAMEDKECMPLQRKVPRAAFETSRYSIRTEDLDKGGKVFEQHEGRDSTSRVATFLIEQWWGRPADMVDAITVVLLTWNATDTACLISIVWRVFWWHSGIFYPISAIETLLR